VKGWPVSVIFGEERFGGYDEGQSRQSLSILICCNFCFME